MARRESREKIMSKRESEMKNGFFEGAEATKLQMPFKNIRMKIG